MDLTERKKKDIELQKIRSMKEKTLPIVMLMPHVRSQTPRHRGLPAIKDSKQ